MLLDTQLFLGKKHYSVKPYPAGRLGGPQLSFPAGVTMLNAVTVGSRRPFLSTPLTSTLSLTLTLLAWLSSARSPTLHRQLVSGLHGLDESDALLQ